MFRLGQQTKTTSFIAALMFVVDMTSLVQDTGRQVDWTFITDAYRRGNFNVKLAEAVTIGETAIDVDALLYAMQKGDVINFGTYAPVTVTVGVAGASAAATSVPVTALPGPIPKGQIVYLGTNKFLVLNADAAAGATSLTTLAIPTAVVSGDTGVWRGGVKGLRLAADAAQGAISITVDPPNWEIADDSIGFALLNIYLNAAPDPHARFIPAGTVMIEVDPSTNRKMIPVAIHPQGTSATGQTMIALTDMKTDSYTDSLTGYGVTYAGILYENLLPDAIKNGGTLPAGYKTLLGARYVWKISRDSRGGVSP